MEFDGRRPYHFHDPKHAASRRWEIWMDGAQARAVQAEWADCHELELLDEPVPLLGKLAHSLGQPGDQALHRLAAEKA